MNLAEKE